MSAAAGGGGSREARKEAARLASKKSETVRVYVRVRPMSSTERADNRTCVVTVDERRGEIAIQNPKADASDPPKTFTFDHTYGPNTEQKHLYDVSAAPIVQGVLEGFNGTIFCYGQTGAGKTFTMEGAPDPPTLRGVMPNSFSHIFDSIGLNSDPSKQFLVRASYLEIYNEEIRDLLSRDPRNKLELKESVDSGVYVKDLTSFVVKSASEIDAVLQAGKKNRSTGATLMNATSSRSHSIFTITVETSELGEDGEGHIRVGKLNMVDLAGSERQSKTGATGQRLKEATKINLSLSALGNVISALVDSKSKHVPYRDSKLTRLLQDSLGGNTKTAMIANCGPAGYNYDETISTLRYADRAKRIKNKPRINEDPKDAMLREFQDEIKRLRQQLQEQEKASAATTTVTVDGKTVQVPMAEKVVERVVEKVVGISEEEAARIREEAEARQRELEEAAAAERQALLMAKAKTDEERQRLQEELEAKARGHEEAERAKQQLQSQLQQMQEKLLMGGKIMDKAAKQEEELRRAQMELEERKRQEGALARELEEANLMIEEQYASMAEEVQVKTRKLKKVFTKWKQAQAEVQDLQREFQQEREDMLDTIRKLTKDLKLKEALLGGFVPEAEVERLRARAAWDEQAQEWSIQAIELAGNRLRVARPQALGGSRRPESAYARSRQQLDSNPRFMAENIARMDLDMPDPTTAEYHQDAKEQVQLMGDEELRAAEAQGTAHAYAQPGQQRAPVGRGGGGGGGGGAYPQARGFRR